MIEHPTLRQDVQVLVGMDDTPLLFDPVTGHYHRLNRLSAAAIALMDGRRSPDDIAAEVDSAGRGGTRARGLVEDFIEDLRSKELLVGCHPVPERRRTRLEWILPRFMVWRGFADVLAPLSRALARVPGSALAVGVGGPASIGYIVAILEFLTRLGQPVVVAPAVLAVAAVVQLVSVFCHETCHAIVAGRYGVPVRGLGVALVFWAVPVAYVDRTDAYRLRGRSGRVAISLAGMVSDGWWALAAVIVAATTHGFPQEVASLVIPFQLIMLVANLNPFTPSDGVAALEAATGLIDVRGRSLKVLKATVTRAPLPPYLRSVSPLARRWYLLYGALVLVMGCSLVGMLCYRIVVGTLAVAAQVGR